MSTAHSFQTGKLALVLSNRLGDTLYQMTLANNLRKAGRDLTVYGVHGHALREWFPDFDIQPLPADIDGLAGYDTIVQMDPDSPFDGLTRVCRRFLSTKEWGKIRAAPRRHASPNGILDEFRRFSVDAFGLTEWSDDNGLRAPARFKARLHDKRVILHPTSSEAERCWTPGKYVLVARRLRAMGYEPTFVLAPSERAFWRPLLEQAHASLVEAPSIDGVAAQVYESGWFIGTDSGIGHLASCCGLPTVTIVDRPRNMPRWRPAWADNIIVKPWWLPLRTLRRKYWREATTVAAVMRCFGRMVHRQRR
ncbi:glycosyltransferase family 9 protein [Achromobacter xylosoxidans]|uniref:glycosyltransferase family 9 protein n=1 Tax=Alcaligenes xylosoxydans xylosoxydans TaxID=85698 RepID=UPI0003322364|nr:glycosyltransferase family 9 protein [Achromobacter xylosoxidans]KAA5924194.1 glycosyltransferase family 9 protein [Achromobacter xylosoxidans]KMJ87671.1 glycosyltransferase [Achromobacter xylosoxidans]KOQ18894.1 glycosyltransferase [Achromobacter xylosoxidans]KOQ32303.1 glycosyltransferase [Achromobacter xylosoxidans]KOQ37060.1 glycosyltransferase [Achromobacter xylosoxidans]